MNRILMLGLMLLCGVHSPTAREEELADELKCFMVELGAGPWDINDKESLMHPETGICNYRAFWGCYYEDGELCCGHDKDGNLLCGYDKDGKLLDPYDEINGKKWSDLHDKDGKWLGGYDEDGKALWEYHGDENCLTFNTIEEVRALAQKLRYGKASRDYLVFYKDLNQIWKSGTKAPSLLCFDPRGFFFSIDQTSKDLLIYSYWTLNKAFFEASSSPEKMAEFQKQIESERLKQKVIRGELELELTKHKAESAEREAKLEAIITTTRNESAVLKELLRVTRDEAELDKEKSDKLQKQILDVLSKQGNILHNTQLILKSVVGRGFGLPPELMDLLQDMHSEGAASSGLDRSV